MLSSVETVPRGIPLLWYPPSVGVVETVSQILALGGMATYHSNKVSQSIRRNRDVSEETGGGVQGAIFQSMQLRNQLL